MNILHLVLVCVGSYLLGSIPFGVLVSKRHGVDIMAEGSKNPGATNVWRTLGWRSGLVVFLLDVLKGAIPAAIGVQLFGTVDFGVICGLSSVAGHTFSPWLNFKGGKGIATGFGLLIGSAPIVAVIAFGVFAVLLTITRYVSLSSIVGTLSIIGTAFWLGFPPFTIVAYSLFSAFVVYRHRSNISRLLSGTENKFSIKSKGSAQDAGKNQSEPEGEDRDVDPVIEPE
jgi:glycerol-3-phosphate acyltransferase PlsY